MIETVWATERQVDYARDVQPLLHSRCRNCHNQNLSQKGLSLETRAGMLVGGESGPAMVPESSAESLIIQHAIGLRKPRMPLDGAPLSEKEIGLLREWIDQGAPGASSQAASESPASIEPRRPDLPDDPSGQLANPIDHWVQSYLKQQGIPFPEPVADSVFVRRAYLDLWGLLPSPQESGTFVEATDSNKRDLLIDLLLGEDTKYAEHWMSYWNDLLRNDEGVRYHGGRESISDWLLGALEANLSYDRFVSKLLNPSGEDDPKGFLIGVNWRGTTSASQKPVMQAAQNSALVFSGVNLKCASCHDSFVDRWKLADGFGLASMFSEEPLEMVRCDVALGQQASPKFLFPELAGIPTGLPLAERQRIAASLFTSPENGRFPRTLVNRIWTRLLGRPLVEDIDDPGAKPWSRDLLDWLASDFVDHGYDVRKLLRRIMTSRTYQLPSIDYSGDGNQGPQFKGPALRRLTSEQFLDGISSVTGYWRVLGSDEAGPGSYRRDWRFASTSLTRALGRPVRDQVVIQRNHESTTLQALELVNGREINGLIRRGAKRLLYQSSPPPANRIDSGIVRWGEEALDIDVTGAEPLRLLAVDIDSYDPERVAIAWAEPRLVGPNGTTRLTQIRTESPVETKPVRFLDRHVERTKGDDGEEKVEVELTPLPHEYGLMTGLPSEIIYDLRGGRYERFQAWVGVDEGSHESEISPKVRFFVFTQEPDREHLAGVSGAAPVVIQEVPTSWEALSRYLYRYALGRSPAVAELEVAKVLLLDSKTEGEIEVEGLEDLLWSIFVSPEFQYIQ